MMARRGLWIGCAVVAAALAGCTPRHPYRAPPDLTPETGAVLKGSRTPVASPLAEDVRAIVTAVDGQLTANGRYEWDQPILVPPGSHLLQLAALQGQIKVEAAIRVSLEPHQEYVVRLQGPSDAGQPAFIWLEDTGSGGVVGSKLAVAPWVYPQPSGVIYVPPARR